MARLIASSCPTDPRPDPIGRFAAATDRLALLYLATVLARRLDGANQALIELKSQLQAGQPPSVIGKTVEKIEGLLGAGAASLVYAGYPYDPYA